MKSVQSRTLVILLFLFAVLFSYARSQNTVSNGSRVVDTLKAVVVISANGNRGPIGHFKESPYPDGVRYWPYGTGQLTKAGRVGMYDLGVKMRSLYDGFLTSEYTDSDIYAESTDDELAMLSGETFLAGLYPPVVKYQIVKKNLHWMPIPVYISSTDDTMDVYDCAKYLQLYETLKTEFSSEYSATIEAITKYVNTETGGNITGLDGVTTVHDAFYSMVNEGYTLPDWAETIYSTTLNYLMKEFYLDMYSEDEDSVNLIIGLFFEDILSYMSEIVSGDSPSPGPGPNPTGGPGPGPQPTGGPGPNSLGKDEDLSNVADPGPGGSAQIFKYFSGYNVSLIALQKVLGVPRDSRIGLITPASAIVFELHQDNSTQNYTVQALYVDGGALDVEPTILPILDCDESCDYDYFVTNTENYTTISDFDKACEVTSLD